MSFVHLHNHSDFSLLDGAVSVDNLIKQAVEFGQPGLALTDHGNMFGALKFYKACRKANLNPIVGNEFYVAGASRKEKTGTEGGNKYYHLILLAKNEQGYKNLIKLTSLAYIEGFYYKPRIDWELLKDYHEGLICSTACIAGEVPQYIMMDRLADAAAVAGRYKELFGADNYFLEIQDHGMPEERLVNKAMVPLAKKMGLRLIATNDIHYLSKSDVAAHDALLCVGTNRKVSDPKRMRFPTPEFYFKSSQEMADLFREVPEAISNTLLVNEMVNLKIPLPGPLLPAYDIPPSFTSTEDSQAELEVRRVEAYLATMDDEAICKPDPRNGKLPVCELAPQIRSALAARMAQPVTRFFIWQTYRGLEGRYAERGEAIKQRLDYELGTIILMDFVGYFLIVQDFIAWAKDRDIPVGPGRGSGAGSLVAYSLRITDIDPLRYGLLFERLLNPERVSMPDFDIDFCTDRRAEVIDYVTQKYGSNRVGQIITFGTLKAKAVIKDVARALDLTIDESNMITKLIPDDDLKINLTKAFEQSAELRALEENPRYAELFAMARKLENKNRNTSLHAAGIVIGKTDLMDYVPLFKDSKTGTLATQFTMDQLEECGLVKMDFLGLKTLTLVRKSLGLIRKRGIELKETDIPDTDAKTFALLSEGKSASVFQFESDGMQGILRQAKPGSIEDLIALNALYRPGPMDNIPQFIDSKWGRTPIKYPAPALEKYLKETYGVIVYQEQVMQVAQEIAGYSLGRADLLRRAMGKKKLEVLAEEEKPFIEGAIARGYTAAKAKEIFDILVPFAGYGFNKSHAAAYSVLAYQTAWLKANYPAEFMAANLTNEISDAKKLTKCIAEVRSMNLPLRAPDINQSEALFTVVDGREIVYGLIGVKGVGEGVVTELILERDRHGPFKDFMDFLERVGVRNMNKRVIETLVRAGCFDSLGHRRSELVINLERAFDYAQKKVEAGAYGQASLFGADSGEEFPPFRYETCEEWPRSEILSIEKQLLGFYFSGHPLDAFRSIYDRCCDVNFEHLERSSGERLYTLVGQLVEWREILSKKGKRMAFGKVEVYSGAIDIVVFAKTLEQAASRFKVDDIVFLKGKIDLTRDPPSFKVEAFADPLELKEKSYRDIHIVLRPVHSEDELEPLRDVLFSSSGQCGVVFHVPAAGRRAAPPALEATTAGLADVAAPDQAGTELEPNLPGLEGRSGDEGALSNDSGLSGDNLPVRRVARAPNQTLVRAHAQINCSPRDEVLERLREVGVVEDLWLD
ncbi:MAG: DNA polymerase III subunit alpha [Spirochaetes bacterium GWD1_61_31]|nr:MAG: DNA polymerase III subunit alpha [Spirochaetes bacterium GWB1_60_80]OHD32574.1 MAG: DNA polymerase III subunit alpha [Spirochaetes bacterium GWC1_61_12]OHD34803.1 MAG: DNA polymerase III subunit alpha [Spirochaetes bacterium GWD1_61_31]OHD44568.1 MAG: DNA polymerase III subunit alpha [Spirochaetes bacterium GWE1_60_18]OHD58643.1 MAG: DNA polymerase III subunit alpha [Spirochaetes bacterium GWF1_60_12]HAP43226.1 DNA polymerase III subunit alpha [Spirochaetaceae bacterium]